MIVGGSRGGSDTVRRVEFKSAVKIEGKPADIRKITSTSTTTSLLVGLPLITGGTG